MRYSCPTSVRVQSQSQQQARDSVYIDPVSSFHEWDLRIYMTLGGSCLHAAAEPTV